MTLRDSEIRASLRTQIQVRRPSPVTVVEELHVDFGKAIADVVALYNYAHCFEIKGSTDKIQRVLVQEKVFSKAFLRMTLVTTDNHVDWASKYVPAYWGITVATYKSGSVVLTRLRQPGNSPHFSKEISLRTIWRPELLELAHELNIEVAPKENKSQIATKIAQSLSRQATVRHISEILRSRLDRKVPKHESQMGNSEGFDY